MRWIRKLSVTVTFLLLFASPSMAATSYVPDDFGTIQTAIDSAVNGDLIIVRDGTYTEAGNKNLDFRGKALTLQSENGPEACIIDCEGDGRAAYFRSGEAAGTVIDGFTITNGMPGPEDAGGAIRCDSSSPTIRNCVMTGNTGPLGGGAIYCYRGSSPAISNCTIQYNTGTMGGGIRCYDDSSPAISGSIISGNSAGYGGGIYCSESSSAIITGGTISRNSSDAGGGAVCCYNSSWLTIARCTISGNEAASHGGGILCGYGSTVVLNNSNVLSNSSETGNGGGLYCFEDSSLYIYDCTLSGNKAVYGGGLYCSGPGLANMDDCIFWEDVAASAGPEIGVYGPGSVSVTYSDVEGGQETIYNGNGGTIDSGSGNIDSDPLFIGGGDYHLTAKSPCIDAAPFGVLDVIIQDIDGDIRPQGAGLDIGADEYPVRLTRIWLKSPADQAAVSCPPLFSWAAHGGTSHAFAVDLSYSADFTSYWSTYDDARRVLTAENWQMPQAVWQKITPGKRVYWRVRGIDRNQASTAIVTSAETWSFYKQ